MQPAYEDSSTGSTTTSASGSEDGGLARRGRTNNAPADKEKDEKKPVDVGMTSEAKTLYRQNPHASWEEWAPGSVDLQSQETADSMKFALIVRRELRPGETGAPVLQVHSIVVQSPLIKAQLGKVFSGYPGMNMNLKKIQFFSPFHEFFYRWFEFGQARPQDEDSTEFRHYKLLFDIVHMEMRPHIDQTEDLLVNGSITFDYLWAIFEPSSEVYSVVDSYDRIFHLVDSYYQDTPYGKIFVLKTRFVDTDGDQLGFLSTSLVIRQFVRIQPISDLSVIPVHQTPGIDAIRQQLEQRGRKFEALVGSHYRSYTGFFDLFRAPIKRQYVSMNFKSGKLNPDINFLKREKERVMIDRKSYLRHTGGSGLDLQPLHSSPSSIGVNPMAFMLGLDDSDDESDDVSLLPPAIRTMKHMARRAKQRFPTDHHELSDNKSLTETHYALCTPSVRGFCLKTKKWATFQIDGVSEVEWNDAAFSHLVLESDYKRVVWAFVQTQLSDSDGFDDVIKGKGKGMIMLLAGDPGTGKTLTSESVAESLRRPLYSMSAGELGDTATAVEERLQKVLELSSGWGAVLLLDECDVFLERRNSKDLRRNQLVSVFLRLLEYYQGVMFLTSNRADNFDPAFESRIHLTIQYPNLDATSRLHIWKMFIGSPDHINQTPPSGETGDGPSKEVMSQRDPSLTNHITETDLLRFAQENLNGRQIKNIVKTARLLAASDKVGLSPDHVDTVLRIKGVGRTLD